MLRWSLQCHWCNTCSFSLIALAWLYTERLKKKKRILAALCMCALADAISSGGLVQVVHRMTDAAQALDFVKRLF